MSFTCRITSWFASRGLVLVVMMDRGGRTSRRRSRRWIRAPAVALIPLSHPALISSPKFGFSGSYCCLGCSPNTLICEKNPGHNSCACVSGDYPTLLSALPTKTPSLLNCFRCCVCNSYPSVLTRRKFYTSNVSLECSHVPRDSEAIIGLEDPTPSIILPPPDGNYRSPSDGTTIIYRLYR
jgi:hypothetical protein